MLSPEQTTTAVNKHETYFGGLIVSAPKTTMDQNRKVHTVMETLYGLFEWKRLSSSQKLMGLTVFASIIAVFMDRWGLLIVLIVTMMMFAYLTDRALTGGWLTSPDPLVHVLGALERCRDSVSTVYRRIFSGNHNVSETQELRKRSESIASSHIPDLDIDIECGSAGSSFQKKIRLELNSIILLIIRDFVQFWYNTFSYNSQFLKDARQFLFRGFHNIVDRISRLGPHKTSAKLIEAYRKHLASFQTAQSMFDHQEKPNKWPPNIQVGARTTLKKLESVDKAFPLNFQFHPALKNKEAEKQYLRSLTKVILLCSCSRDVVSAQSAQLFFIEVLSMNVLLPVMETLSTPDQLYELLIKLTYNDDAIVNDDTIKELIDVEVKRMQLKNAGKVGTDASAIAGLSPESCEDTGVCTDETESSQNSGKCANHNTDNDSCAKESAKLSKEPESLTTSQVTRRKSKTCDDISASHNSVEKWEQSPERAENCNPKSDVLPVDNKFSSSVVDKSELTLKTPTTECVESNLENIPADLDCEKTKESSEMGEADGLVKVVGETEEELQKSTLSTSADNDSTPNNHIYGEIVSTNIPIIKPKLQALKDLFKSKRSKQTEESKSQAVSDKDQGSEVQKGQSELMPKPSTGDSILPTQRLKSLRLSPLLNRSSKLGSSVDSSNSSSPGSQSGRDGGRNKAVAADSGSERQTPSPQPTPSPSQPFKGGPLSFFKFRKPTLDFKKSSSSAACEERMTDTSSAASSTHSDDNGASSSADQPAVVILPSVQVSDESMDVGESDGSLKSPPPPSSSSEAGADPQQPRDQHSVSISSYVEVTSEMDLKTPDARMSGKLFLGSRGEDVEECEEAESLGVGGEEEDGPTATPPDSSLIFQDIAIPSTMSCQEYRSNSQFTVYNIEYEALHFSETGIPVMKTGTAKRRYREFVNLMSRLEDNPAYKRLLKDVKGPKRWLTLPFKNMDKESVASRQKALELFLKSLIEVEAVCNGPEMREFLAYEGDSHIAFVKKPSEINVPRIDKMLARTVSGVFDKLKSLPNLPQGVISGIRGRDPLVDRKDSTETDADNIQVVTDFSHDYIHDMSLYNLLRDVSESYVRDVQTLGHPELTPASPTSQLLKDMGSALYDHIVLLQVPRVEGDGAEHPDGAVEGGGQDGVGVSGQLVLCDAVLDFVVQLLGGQQHWLCHQRTLVALRNLLGRTLDRWVRETVSGLTSEERCLYYIRLLRETLWPSGKLFSARQGDKTPEERAATRALAKRFLLDFFPGSLTMALGADSLESGVDVILESLQYTQLNKHFLYSSIDMLLESLFPEIADPQFQGRLLPRS
ncbi:uncharacterized protein LOC143291305 [Babylonia areolata]|uniref:uncharacterized protein LOC143291305 n=1 Tax=Babylonia areolata TaxID=304850 RepID=UPI003FD6052F